MRAIAEDVEKSFSNCPLLKNCNLSQSTSDQMIHGKYLGKKTKEDRLELIRFMDERGVFLVKGSMEYVAGKLGLSKVTLYGYLDKIHGKR